METTVFNQAGKAAGKVTLPENIFGVAWNPDLVHEVVVAMQSNARAGTAKVKDRSEVSGGGKKPWRQKGTGRARHGSRRSPIWVGGGVTHGPTNEKDFSKKLNKKVRQKALAVTLSRKQADGELVFVEALNFEAPKTADAKSTLADIAKGAKMADLATKRNNAALVVLSERDEAVEKSFRNFGNIEVKPVKDINPVDLLTYKFVLFVEPEKAIESLSTRVA
ncbi:50S ribosomal protein L4 [bacterium]|nr:50S ribosomal protein L4 [bacterium]|tara:strand:+ start:997 stop:1659 length:663 start_codon:yes stop_codon:yes gene_type:complete